MRAFFGLCAVVCAVFAWGRASVAGSADPAADAAWRDIQEENPGATVRWSDEGFAELVTGLDMDLGLSDVSSAVEAARSFALANRALFGLSEKDIGELRLKTFVRGDHKTGVDPKPEIDTKRIVPMTVVKFYQYKDGVYVHGSGLSFVFGNDLQLHLIRNRTIPNLTAMPDRAISRDEAEEIFRSEFDLGYSKRVKSEAVIRGHEGNGPAWLVQGGEYAVFIDAQTGEVGNPMQRESAYSNARAKVYTNKEQYDGGDSPEVLWLYSLNANYGSGQSIWTQSFGKYFKMYDYNLVTIVGDDDADIVAPRHSNTYWWSILFGYLPYYNYPTDIGDDDDSLDNPGNVTGNTFWHLQYSAYEYDQFGFDGQVDDTTDTDYDLVVLVNENIPGGNPAGCCGLSLSDYDLTVDEPAERDDWPMLHLSYFSDRPGESWRPPVIYHEFNHFVAYALTGYSEGTNKCGNDWGALDEALAKFMGDSQWNAAPVIWPNPPDNWQMDQICCYPNVYTWEQDSNRVCCAEDVPPFTNNVHDYGLSLAQALWEARTNINNISAGDGRDFLHVTVFLAMSALSASENLHSAAVMIDAAAYWMQAEWCNEQYPCPYQDYDDEVRDALIAHGYLGESCNSDYDCDAPGDIFCPRRGDSVPAGAGDCTQSFC